MGVRPKPSTMSVAELIEILKTYPQDAPTAYSYDTQIILIQRTDIFVSADGIVIIGDEFEEYTTGKWSARQEAGLDR